MAGSGGGGDARWRCAGCGAAIATEHVLRVDAERRWALGAGPSGRRRTGYVLVTARCACSERPVVSRRRATYEAFVAMFGGGVALPYVTPFRVIDLRDDDPLVRRWCWELEQVEGVDDFELWADAERRKPLDELRHRRRAGRGDEAAP